MKSIIIVGRPNVGKSTLFNRIIGRRKALVHPEPGTTRDRNENSVAWKGKKFMLVDTGGWGDETSAFSTEIKKQLEMALTMSDYVLLVVDGKNGFHPIDAELNGVIRKMHKKVILAVNKIDTQQDENKVADFYRLGVDEVLGISSAHGKNISELMDKITSVIEAGGPEEEDSRPADAVRIILVGKPNVGKSSLLNAICKEERAIVSEVAGTTREAFDICVERKGKKFILIDTPGLRRKRKFAGDLEYLSSLSAHHALENADVAVLVVDAVQGIGETEARIAELIIENRLGCLVAINKWDLIEEREEAVKRFQLVLEQKLQFLWWSKVVFISAKTGQRSERIFDEVLEIYKEYSKTVDGAELKDTVERAFFKTPFTRLGKTLKLQRITQTGNCPPEFTLIVNRPEMAHFSYRRHISNVLREKFGFTGTPLVLKFQRGGEQK